MSSTNSIDGASESDLEAAAIKALILERATAVLEKGKTRDERRAELPTALHKLFSALRVANYRGLADEYDSGNLDYLIEVVADPPPTGDSPEWRVILALYYPNCKPCTWRRGMHREWLDKYVPALLRLECSSQLPDGVHCTGTMIPKPLVLATAEDAVDKVLETLRLIGLKVCEKENETT